MCEGFYNEPVKHRYIDCPYYNGCLCGLRQQTSKHVEGCVIAKEIRRKKRIREEAQARENQLRKQEQPLISNSRGNQPLTCIYCFRAYSYDRAQHETRYCPYFVGCPHCGRKKIDGKHTEECKVRILADPEGVIPGEEPVIYMVCQYCRGEIPMEDWDDHRRDKCGPKQVSLIVEETTRKSQAQAGPTKWCWMCDKKIYEDIFESHQVECKKKMAARYAALPKKEHGELFIVDDRPRCSNLKEVKFVEEP
jgi:hypothetical protein